MGPLDTDHLVVGAGAAGLAFADALVDHADVHVTIVDRRSEPGGHWLDAYPFVRLHQASQFYGVASTQLGTGAVQTSGPEKGLQERASRAEIVAYFASVVRRLEATGRVTFLGGHEHHVDGSEHVATSVASGEEVRVRVRRRLVDASYVSPTIPATTPPPFAVGAGAEVVPIHLLPEAPASRFVIVGSGKTATDGIVWLLGEGVDPDRITWVRPRDPWMLNRAVVQPDPSVALGLSADILEAAAEATSLDDLFLRLEATGAVLRVNRDVLPSMAKTPTLGEWELDLLRSVDHVVRLGHVRGVTASSLDLDQGSVALAPATVVVHCAASGLPQPPLVPIWSPDAIRLQTIRAGFPCFGAALAGVVEATRDDDRERNRLCPPNAYGNTLADWARMQLRGSRATRTFGAEPDLAAWADGCVLNPARVDPALRDDLAVLAGRARVAAAAEAGLAGLERLAG